ncbi:SRPBCC family protein [Metallosphaera tengchongensis]|uniref:SRPBCC family protein n=2 Tax=Metallosphaera tengchongensis TaxID=1532350 RepID=A0A6N0P0X8_9CREN|nr:SRPBCC family protein [Metallosphaera tengchongensis]
MKYVPAFDDLIDLGENEWELRVSWLITLKLRVTKQVTKDEITYLIKKVDGLIKINSYLRFTILPTMGRTVVRLTFFYKGPLETVAKKQTQDFYKRGVEIFKRDMEGIEAKESIEAKPNPATRQPSLNVESRSSASYDDTFPSILEMKTVSSKRVTLKDVDSVLEEAVVKSINSPILVLLSDGTNIVELRFKGGDLVKIKGDLSSLKESVDVILKSK